MKLQQIQSELKAPKGQLNKFGGYQYRSCEDIIEAVKPIIRKQECALVISDEMVEVGGRVYVKAIAKLMDDSGVIAEVSGFAREAENKKGMDDSQITGAASSYARKYALNGLFAIDDTKDADSHDNREQPHSDLFKTFQNKLSSVSTEQELKQIKTDLSKAKSTLPANEVNLLAQLYTTVSAKIAA